MNRSNASKRAPLFLILLFLCGLCAPHQSAHSQVLGDFRSRQSGDWNQSTTWQQWNGIDWMGAEPMDRFPNLVSSASRVDPSRIAHVVLLPGIVSAGDLLILFWTDNATNSSELGGTDLQSWTLLYNDNTANNRRAAFYKIATGIEGASLNITTTASESSVHNVYKFAAGTWQGQPEISGPLHATTATPTPPSLNPAGWDAEPTLWLIANHIAGDGGIAVTAPANYTSNLIKIGTGGGGGGGDAIMASSYRYANNSSENPGSFTNEQSRSTSTATIAIRGIKVRQFPRTQFPVVGATASSVETGDTKTHNISLPSGIAQGDLLLIFYADKNAATAITTTGWIELYDNLDASGRNRRSAYYRIADGTEGTTAIFTTTANERSAHTSYRIVKGTYQGSPVAATPSVSSTDSKLADPPINDPGWGIKNILWIAASHSSGNDNASPPVAPAGYTSLITGYTGNNGTEHARVVTAQRDFTSASENPGPFSLSSNVNWAANTVAILGSGSATVLNNHAVAVTENVQVSQVQINAGGMVALNNGVTFNIPASGSFTVSGTLQTGTDGTAVLAGAGNFTLHSGSSLWVSSPSGIAANANTGNILVAGTRSFHPAANLHFNGTADQVTGDAMGTVNNLTVSGGSTKTLSTNLRVNGTLTFNEARIQSSLDKLLTLANAGAVNGYNQNAMVVGSLKIIGTEAASPYAVLFPLRGKNQLQPITITYGSQSNLDAITVTHVNTNHGGNKHPDVDEVASTEHWDITPSWSAGSPNAAQGVTVELSYKSPNSGKYFSTRISESYGLGHYNGTQWEIAGPMKTLQHNTVDNGISGTVSMGEIKNFSPFAPIAIAESALPVDLGEFNAKLNLQGKVELTWSTYTESLNKGFRIERMIERSNKGFEPLGYVFSSSLNGNSMTTLHYAFVDQAPVAGTTSFYRLVQEDLDGNLTNSEVRRIRIGHHFTLNLFPNPSAGTVTVSHVDLAKRPLMQVVAQTGTVLYKTQPLTQERQLLRFAQPGVYHLSLFYPETGERVIRTIVVK